MIGVVYYNFFEVLYFMLFDIINIVVLLGVEGLNSLDFKMLIKDFSVWVVVRIC